MHPTAHHRLGSRLRHRRRLALLLLSLLPLLPRAVAGETKAPDGFIEIASLEELITYAGRDDVKVRMRPGRYRLEHADTHRFIRFTGARSHFDLTGVVLEIDNRLFRKFGVIKGPDGFYCALDLIGDGIVLEGLNTRNVGDIPGIGSRNKIINITGSDVTLRDVDITTSGSSPWGYGSLFGISGGDVRKMNGIRVGWPARNVRLTRCRVHMRAMGHANFIQGAEGTVVEDCHIDGLLRPTAEILAETSGYAFDHGFRAKNTDYVEGVHVGPGGEILPGEMIALSEDGIRLYRSDGRGHPTGATTIRHCTVRRMRRGVCTGLGPGADVVIDTEATECVAAGFNIGSGDRLENCRADARYAEALSCPYHRSSGAVVDLHILDSRHGLANTLLATINGRDHEIRLQTDQSEWVPADFTIELATRSGYAFYQDGRPIAERITLRNDTPALIRVAPSPES